MSSMSKTPRNYVPAALCLVVLLLADCGRVVAEAAETTVRSGLKTRWADQVNPEAVLPEYPRPQLVRPHWTNLNGVWEFAKSDINADQPAKYEQQILVPFPVESALSGITQSVSPQEAVWYRRNFSAKPKSGERLILHLGAVDWKATVWVNGEEIGKHEGGFDPFSFDITDALINEKSQTITVRVTDPTSRGVQPHGKQSLEPGGIVYTAVTGIWQTVWLEEVPATHFRSLTLTPLLESEELEVTGVVVGPSASDAKVIVSIETPDGKIRSEGTANRPFRVKIPNPQLWSPASPHLYELKAELEVDAKIADAVDSYFGMRRIELMKDAKGYERIALNGKPIFNFGPLDQGWWPDGLYTAPTDEALRWDIEFTKKLGFNTARKHVKIEPARWYYWCDKLGLLVWQDMPNGDRGIGPNEQDIERSPSSEATFRREYKAMLRALHNHPSIVVWVPFNEGWGQFKTNEILAWSKRKDPTRLVGGPSGWVDRGQGDLHDMHSYPGPDMHQPQPGRASVVGEFGGLGLVVPGHLWIDAENWGYETYEDAEALAAAYHRLVDNLWMLKGKGLAAAIYTQTTDVETEVNGLVTYDREVVKIPPMKAREWNKRLYGPDPKAVSIIESSQDPNAVGKNWRYTTEAPSEDWNTPAFDDSTWQTGQAGFGAPNTPGAVVQTEWHTSDIWLRREVDIDASLLNHSVYLLIHHDEEAEVYIDGMLVASLNGFTTSYMLVAIPSELVSRIEGGTNTLAVHCRQTQGGQYIDVGLVAIVQQEEPSEVTALSKTDHLRSAPGAAFQQSASPR